jgi:hypothetical protein
MSFVKNASASDWPGERCSAMFHDSAYVLGLSSASMPSGLRDRRRGHRGRERLADEVVVGEIHEPFDLQAA